MDKTGLQPVEQFDWNTAMLISYVLSVVALELQ